MSKLDQLRGELIGRDEKNWVTVPIPGGNIRVWHIREDDDRLPETFLGIKVEMFFQGKETRFFLPWTTTKEDDADYQIQYLEKLGGHLAGAASLLLKENDGVDG